MNPPNLWAQRQESEPYLARGARHGSFALLRAQLATHRGGPRFPPVYIYQSPERMVKPAGLSSPGRYQSPERMVKPAGLSCSHCRQYAHTSRVRGSPPSDLVFLANLFFILIRNSGTSCLPLLANDSS